MIEQIKALRLQGYNTVEIGSLLGLDRRRIAEIESKSKRPCRELERKLEILQEFASFAPEGLDGSLETFEATKTCFNCRESKPLSEFHKVSQKLCRFGVLYNDCKLCHSRRICARIKERRTQDPEYARKARLQGRQHNRLSNRRKKVRAWIATDSQRHAVG